MGQDKKQLSKLLKFVKDLYEDPDNKEFAAGIQAIVLHDIQAGQSRETWTKQISEIYELCLKNNLREQAEDLYKAFPMTEIAGDLASLYIEMEDARRHNDFDAFGFNLYQQIELIVNTLIKGMDFPRVYNAIKGIEPFTVYDKFSGKRIRTKDNKYQTAELLILIPKKEDDGSLTYKSLGKPLSSLTALEKARAVFYMINNGCNIDTYRRDELFSAYTTLSSIYNVRNHDAHSGGIITDYQKRQYELLVEDKTQNYLHFLSFLLTFIKGVSQNYPIPDSLFELAGIAR